MEYTVEALDTYELKNIIDEELKEIPKAGKQFKVTESRLKTLLGDNKYKLVFVKVVDEPKKEKATLKAKETKKIKNGKSK